jgi:hypothetical protein
MRVASFDEGIIKTGKCAYFRLDLVTPLEADSCLKIPIALMEPSSSTSSKMPMRREAPTNG